MSIMKPSSFGNLRRSLFTIVKKQSQVSFPYIKKFSPKSAYQLRTITSTKLIFSESAAKGSYLISQLDQRQFEIASETTLSNLTDQLEDLVQDHGAPDYDVEYSSGVLTLCLANFGTYVLNKQPPNRQIWLSSPISGPKRYDFDTASMKWFYHRDNSTLDDLLESELPKAFNIEVKLSLL